MTPPSVYNILFLGGARRVSMAEKFIASGLRLGMKVNILGYELSRYCPLAAVGEIIEGRRWDDPELMEDLHRMVGEKKISMLVPFVDGAVEVCARYVRLYGDAMSPVSSEEVSAAMFDKAVAAERFAAASLPIPATLSPVKPEFPLIAKPRLGSASKGIIVVNTPEEWDSLSIFHADYLIQSYVADREEFTVDCYASTVTGEPLCVSPRKRLEVIGGEVMSTVTVDEPEITELASRALRELNLRGAVTIQILRDRRDGRLMIMEVNPRLGGGAVCTVCAGADLPSLIMSEALGSKPQKVTAQTGIMIQRYLSETVFNTNE